MKFLSTVYGSTSGSVGGLTYSRNRGGPYTRTRTIPSNPATERQTIARENLASAVAWWTNTLTSVQREGWTAYAATTPVVDALGQQIILSGQQMFIRTSTVRAIAGLDQILVAPTMSGLGNTPQWTGDPVLDASAQTITAEAEAEESVVTDFLLLYMTRPTTASRTAAHEPRRFIWQGNWVLLSESYTVAAPTTFAIALGQKVRVSAVIAWTDGRVSAEASRDVLVTA